MRILNVITGNMTQLMTCTKIKTLIDQWLDDELSAHDQASYAHHLQQCPSCQARCDQARQLQRSLSQLPGIEPAPEFFIRAITKAACHDKTRQWWRTGLKQALGGALAASLVIFALNSSLLTPSPDTQIAQNTPHNRDSGIPTLHVALQQTRHVRIVFTAEQALENSQITLLLPPQTELAGYAGQRQISWQASLNKGPNLLVLPVKLTATEGGGELTARIEHTGQSEEFRLRLISEEAHQSRQALPGGQIMT